jgi:hypothetical protein
MSNQFIAVASAKSFGDFVVAHSVLRRIEDTARRRVRLVALSHLEGLNAILPKEVRVTLLDSGESRVPAIFDVKKCGALAAVRSALSLRRRFEGIERHDDEVLTFDRLGVRERFIAGRWPVSGPRARCGNIYETYARFFSDRAIAVAPAAHPGIGGARSIGIFPESRLVEKRLNASALSLMLDRIASAGLTAQIFILDGDGATYVSRACTRIPRDFQSLANAIRTVDAIISADSLPAHLGEYFGRPVFVACRTPNEYWLPPACFAHRRWDMFGDESRLAFSLDKFLADSNAA